MTSGKSLLDIDEDAFMNVLKINVAGELFGIQAIAPVFEANGGGSIVNVNSIGSMVSGDADGWDPAYAASKGAARAFTRHAAFQLAGKGIRVNSVFPGPIETPMLRESLEADPAIAARVEQYNPLPRTSQRPSTSPRAFCSLQATSWQPCAVPKWLSTAATRLSNCPYLQQPIARLRCLPLSRLLELRTRIKRAS